MIENINSMPKTTKQPPKNSELPDSHQFELFTKFVANDKTDISNTIKLWERIPKYFPARTMDKLRTKDGLAKPFQFEYTDKGISHTVEIQPALIKQPNGEYLAYFPSGSEEIIEEVLKKILSEQQYGLHDTRKSKSETWVRFSISMLERELKARGCARNKTEIKRSIEIMAKTVISFYKENKEVWSGTILQDLLTVDRQDFLENPDKLHAARLPIFISQAIDSLEFRQFNYKRLMNFERQLTRWVYKQLVNEYRQASVMNSYHFLFSTLKSSGLLQQKLESDNRKSVLQALEELIRNEVLLSYETEEKKQGRKIIDVKYIVVASSKFTSEQKAANKRNTDQKSLTVDN